MSGGPYSKGKRQSFKCLGSYSESVLEAGVLNFTLVFSRRSVPAGVICCLLYGRKESQGRDTKWNRFINFCPYMDFFDWFVLFQFLWPSVASLLRFLPYRNCMGIKCIV